MDWIDAATLDNFPVVVAPHVGALAAPQKDGTRYIMGKNGVYKEVSTFWMVRRKLHAPCQLPYGDVEESLQFVFPAPPVTLWHAFIAIARGVFPNECAGLMVFNHQTRAWRLEMRASKFADGSWVDYENPELGADDVAVVDIHSHGQHAAGFSRQDNIDDAGGIKISAVVGKLHNATPEILLRLVAIKEFIPVELTKDGQFKERIQRVPKHHEALFTQEPSYQENQYRSSRGWGLR